MGAWGITGAGVYRLGKFNQQHWSCEYQSIDRSIEDQSINQSINQSIYI